MQKLQSQGRRRSETFLRGLRWLTDAISLLLVLGALPTVLPGQNRVSHQQRETLASVPKGLPGDLLLQLRPLGNRMRVPGKEETILQGQLIDATANLKHVRIVHQLSGMVRIEGLRDNFPLTFDGDLPRGSVDRRDDSLLETFVMDTVEGMIYSARSGGAIRLLGRHFGADPRAGLQDYEGPYYDIYEVIAPVRSRVNGQLRLKRYYFDSQSSLLASTRYTDATVSPPMRVETRFSDWQQVDGSAYPGKIERYENDTLMFYLIVTSATGRGRQSNASFR